MPKPHLLTAHRIGLILTMLFVLNFAAFFVHAVVLGGDAWSGKVDNGHFFVGSHGKFTEVTEAQFVAIQRHGYTFLATFAGGLLGALLMWMGPSSATRFEPPEHEEYWKLAFGTLFVVFLVMSMFTKGVPYWLSRAVYCSFPLIILGGSIEWFVREWNAETSNANDDSTHVSE